MKNLKRAVSLPVFVSLLFAGVIYSCDNSADGDTWARAYTKDTGSAIFEHAVRLKDGTLAVSTPPDLVKVDGAGAVVWRKQLTLDGAMVNPDTLNATPDGGMLLSYRRYEPHTPRWGALRLIKLDGDGALLWQKIYYDQSTAEENWVSICVDESTGAIYATGIDDYAQFARKIGADGALLWTKKITSSVQRYYYNKFVIMALPGGGCVVETTADGVCSLARLDADGALIWKKSYATSGVPDNPELARIDALDSIDAAPDGGYILLGNSEGTPWVMRLDASGSMAWAKMLSGIIATKKSAGTLLSSSKQVIGKCIFRAGDGGYVVSGKSFYRRSYMTAPLYYTIYNDSMSWIIKLGANGSISWQKGYRDKELLVNSWTNLIHNDEEGYGYFSEYADSININTYLPRTDGGVMAAGSTHSYGAGEVNGLLFATDDGGAIAGTGLRISTLKASAAAIGCDTAAMAGESSAVDAAVEDTAATVAASAVVITVTDI